MRAGAPAGSLLTSNGRRVSNLCTRACPGDLTEEMQDALTALSGERDFPVVGKVGARSSTAVTEGLAQPWEGYDRMRVPEITDRLRTEDAATSSCTTTRAVKKGRKMVIEAVEREQRRRRSRGTRKTPK
jgi:hypothetical protein